MWPFPFLQSGSSSGQPNPLNQLLSSVKQQQQQESGAPLPNALKNILEPLQNKLGGPRPSAPPGIGLLGVGMSAYLLTLLHSKYILKLTQ